MLEPTIESIYDTSMRVAIVGYGQMGHEIEKALVDQKHEVAVRIDPVAVDADETSVTSDTLDGSEVVIEFALPDAVRTNAAVYSKSEIPAVVGTTGWESQRDEVLGLFRTGGTYLWGSNFSVGAHLFFAITEYTSKLVSGLHSYDMLMYEIHHRRKKDSPSGTALTIAEKIVENNERKRRIVTSRLDRVREEDELHIGSVRGGEIPGIHTVLIDSKADTVELRHTARNRGGFAVGAVLAAEWLIGKSGVFTVDEFMDDLLGTGGSV